VLAEAAEADGGEAGRAAAADAYAAAAEADGARRGYWEWRRAEVLR
jgi:hypothetical protein